MVTITYYPAREATRRQRRSAQVRCRSYRAWLVEAQIPDQYVQLGLNLTAKYQLPLFDMAALAAHA